MTASKSNIFSITRIQYLLKKYDSYKKKKIKKIRHCTEEKITIILKKKKNAICAKKKEKRIV